MQLYSKVCLSRQQELSSKQRWYHDRLGVFAK